MQRALIVLSDISLTFRHNLATVKIVEDFHARFQSLVIMYLQSFLPGMNSPVSTTPAVLDRIPFKIESKEVSAFLICRSSGNLSISECAKHIKFIGKSSLSLVELVNRVHAIQFQHAASSRATQRFLTFLFKGLTREHHLCTPNQINQKMREHLLQNVPIYSQDTARNDYCLNRHAKSGLLLPQIFSNFLSLKQPHALDKFYLHFTIYDLNRLNSCFNMFSPISFFLPALDSQDLIDFNTFMQIYNKFSEIIHIRNFFFKSLFAENVDLIEAFSLFLEELAGFDDPCELLQCTKQLILFYQELYMPNPRWEAVLLFVSSIWFDPKYLLDSSPRNGPF